MSKGLLFILLSILISNNDVRTINYNGKDVRTTFSANEKFYGTYTGRKKGYLKLNKDGSGEYLYDVFGFAPASCAPKSISLEWGFLVDETDKIVSFKREYGKSYPILLKSTGDTQFQGCRKKVVLDFILEYKDGTLGVSSSDDWKKN